MNAKFRNLFIIIVALVSISSKADEDCLSLLENFLGSSKLLSIHESIGMRGMLSHLKALEQEHFNSAYDQGLMIWGLKIFHAKSLDEAMEHDALIPNPLMKGAYIIGDSYYPNHSEGFESAVENFNKYSKDGLVWFQDGHPKTVSNETIQKIFQFEHKHSFFHDANNHENSFLYQEGWTFPSLRGVILYEELKTSKSILKYAQQIYDAGYRITFNEYFDDALEMLKTQRRRGQDQALNRYGEKSGEDSTAMKELLDMKNLGKAFSVEVVDPRGKLIAGNISYLRDRFVTSETVFYDPMATPPDDVSVSKEATKPINLAKIANWALSERLAEAGISFFDIGMVSGFSSQTRGKLVSREEFLTMLKKYSSEDLQKVDLSVEWTPPARR